MDGYLARLRGANETDIILKNAVQLILNKDLYEIVRKIESIWNIIHNIKLMLNLKDLQ